MELAFIYGSLRPIFEATRINYAIFCTQSPHHRLFTFLKIYCEL